jgi:hypothetical protein
MTVVVVVVVVVGVRWNFLVLSAISDFASLVGLCDCH